jgi:hypothetical protein
MSPHSATVVGSDGFEVTANSGSISLHGGGGNDIVRMYDSADNDEFLLQEGTATLSGHGHHFTLSANGFSRTLVYAKAGGDDTAELLVPEQRAKIYRQYTKALGKNYVRCKFFESVNVEAERALIYGSEGQDRFETWGNQLKVDYPDPSPRLEYPIIIRDPIQVIDPEMPIIRDPSPVIALPMPIVVDPPRTITASVRAETICAYAYSDPSDRLVMHDSWHDDVLIAKPHKVVMANAPDENEGIGRGELYELTARGFRDVTAIADWDGGNDVAKLYDSSEDGTDVWAADHKKEHTWSTMTSPKRLLYKVWDFEQVGGYGFSYGDAGSSNRNVKDHTETVDFVFQQGVWDE